MNIKIIVGCFYPEIHPRAFRAAELAKEFVRNGHNVTVINLHPFNDYNYKDYEKEFGVTIKNLNIFKGASGKEASKHMSFFRKVRRFLINYFLCGYMFQYGRQIVSGLRAVMDTKTDMLIALSTPFPCIYGCAKYLSKINRTYITVADSGDPFYYSKQGKRAIWFKYIEKFVYRQYDYLTIPTANAIPLYSPLLPENKIKIIPQGFNMRNLNLFKGELNRPVKFAYAGVFYWDIRNPEFLLQYLNSLKEEYEFYIYMRYEDATLNEILSKYPHVKSKIKMQLGIPHDDLIYELSRMHFLINIENISNTQMPSKLIDYGMAGRPIFSCNEKNFLSTDFNSFMNGDYSNRYIVNVDEYNIERIAKQFLDLC